MKDLADQESKTDEVFYRGKPGIPRIGPPRKVVQTPTESIFFYEDISGDPCRIIPTDGRPHRANAMHTSERVWRDGENLAHQVTVDDPKVLTVPLDNARPVKPSAEPLLESPRCVEADANRLVNDDYHGQR